MVTDLLRDAENQNLALPRAARTLKPASASSEIEWHLDCLARSLHALHLGGSPDGVHMCCPPASGGTHAEPHRAHRLPVPGALAHCAGTHASRTRRRRSTRHRLPQQHRQCDGAQCAVRTAAARGRPQIQAASDRRPEVLSELYRNGGLGH